MKKIVLLSLLALSLDAKILTSEDNFQHVKKEFYTKQEIINHGVKRSVYKILDSYKNNSKAKLLKKWFKIASQVTYNRSLGVFIAKTSIKVKSLSTQLIFLDEGAMSSSDKNVLLSKYDFLNKFKTHNTPLNKRLFIYAKDEKGKNGNLFLRTMPILDKLTIKRDSDRNYITLRDKSMVILLHKISFEINGHTTHWGYIESPADGRIGWINLKNTKEKR